MAGSCPNLNFNGVCASHRYARPPSTAMETPLSPKPSQAGEMVGHAVAVRSRVGNKPHQILSLGDAGDYKSVNA